MTSRNYDREYREYHGKPEQIKNRSSRNKARRKVIGLGFSPAGKDVDHIDGNPRNNAKGNLRIVSKKANRSRKK